MTKLYLNSSKAKAKVTLRSRGRMKITIKFNEDESQAFKNWAANVRPPQLDEDSFYKQIFFNGVGAINQQLSIMARESLKDPATRKQLKESGVDIDKLEAELDAAQNATGPVEPLENPVTEIITDDTVTEVRDSSEQGEPKPETDPAAPVEVISDTPETTK